MSLGKSSTQPEVLAQPKISLPKHRQPYYNFVSRGSSDPGNQWWIVKPFDVKINLSNI